MAVGLLRNYNDAYLEELGAPGTRGLAVMKRGGGAAAAKARFDGTLRFDVFRQPSEAPVATDLVWNEGAGRYDVEMEWRPVTESRFAAREVAMADHTHANRDCSSPRGMTGGLELGRLFAGDDKAMVASMSVGSLHMPYWGAANAPGSAEWDDDPVGYIDAGDGNWVLPFVASALGVLPGGGYGPGIVFRAALRGAFVKYRQHRVNGGWDVLPRDPGLDQVRLTCSDSQVNADGMLEALRQLAYGVADSIGVSMRAENVDFF